MFLLIFARPVRCGQPARRGHELHASCCFRGRCQDMPSKAQQSCSTSCAQAPDSSYNCRHPNYKETRVRKTGLSQNGFGP
mmetsp:Transcript_8815/g.16115  ORF Transcript_8815/g.16115 Transcript_8815/m.16115 type:complete len:80 (-) Transcript_8815:9-248(-)